MDKEVQNELNWLNENLNAVVRNQAMIYAMLEKIADQSQPDGKENQ